jgi:alkylation response protein AidB-like acyl-CoA dehydrogenase
MDFDFTEEQQMLRQMTREFLAAEAPLATVRRLMEQPEGYSADTWRQMAELGLLGVTIPEAYGGQGLGMVEQALVLEEIGRSALPSPYFATVILASAALATGGSEDQRRRYLGGIAGGQIKATLALLEDRVSWGPEAVRLPAARNGDTYVLNGTKWLVPYAHVADLLLIPARTDGGGPEASANGGSGITIFAVERESPGVEVRTLETMDLTNRVCAVTLTDARVPAARVIGEIGGGGPLLEAVLQRAAVGASAEMLGAARKCLEMSVEYAKSREQFGQPIGSFQAVKHKCAEMLLEVEQAHSATYYAAWAQSAGAPDAALAASVAKAYVNGAARKVCGDAIQVHGGIGFTWEFDLHLYFKRAKHLEPLYGDVDYHRERALALMLAAQEQDEQAAVRADGRTQSGTRVEVR